MAKVQDRQLAQCIGVYSYTDKKGEEKEVYTMSMDGAEFSLFESKYFKAERDRYYAPVVSIIPTGYLDKNKVPRARNTPVVNWVEA